MKPTVYLARRIPQEAEEYIARHCEVRKWESPDPIPRSVLLQELSEAEGLLTSGTRIDRELLERAPRLKVVSNVSVGYDNFDIAAMKERGVIGTNTPHVLDETVADLVMGMMLAVARRIPELDRIVKEGRWQRGDDRQWFGMDVHHATLGIIGMGRIGEAIARRARFGFQMEVLYYNRKRKPEAEDKLGVRWAKLETLLSESDFVVVMVPLTRETERLIGRNELALMKPTAFLINASRGQTVDEQALIEALQNGTIRGAALDVYEKEPVAPDNPLLAMDHVVTLPHIGSATAKTRLEMAMLAARNLVAALTGETPPNVVKELLP